RRERSLPESEERFRNFIDQAFDGYMIQEKGIILQANHKMAALFGYSLPEFVGNNVMLGAAPESRELVARYKDSDKPGSYDIIGLRKDGSKFNIEVFSQAQSFENRMVRVVVVRDITARKQIESEREA